MRTSTAPGIDGAHVDEVTSHISRYLRSYAALSVELLGRWPAYVPEDERYFESPTSWTTAELAPTMPPHLLRPAPDDRRFTHVAWQENPAFRRLLQGYLAWKWGSQSLLPNGHPFKTSRPLFGGTQTITLAATNLPTDPADGKKFISITFTP